MKNGRCETDDDYYATSAGTRNNGRFVRVPQNEGGGKCASRKQGNQVEKCVADEKERTVRYAIYATY